MREAEVYDALVKLIRILDEAGIPYAVAGAMALNEYGYRRVTTDVDVLLTRDGLAKLKAEWLGRGYIEKFPGSRSLRDAENHVDIDVLIAGDFPGDGRPKPVAFPDPASVARRGRRGSFLPLPTLIELKLASGMTAAHRLRDLADVLEVIRILELPRDFGEQLDPYVQDKFYELWQSAQTVEDE